MKFPWLAVTFSSAETLISILNIVSLGHVSLVVMSAPLIFSSLLRTLTLLLLCVSCWRGVIFRNYGLVVNFTAVHSVAAFMCFTLALRNVEPLTKLHDVSIDEGFKTKAALLILCSLSAAFASCSVVYISARTRRTITRQVEEKVRMNLITSDDFALRTFVLKDAGDRESGDDGNMDYLDSCCIICLDQFCSEDMICELVCHHKFHKSCIDAWIGAHVKRNMKQCPMRCALTERPKVLLEEGSEVVTV
eukprot:TRINITY_DN1441_c0_g2_i1.p1 TRINITY_DN1441_c0_g2~~TRINITY_DN1441_c0_g2_i1.p1  ORF type:complete len:248 (+),score=33.67 TRINITY_DN1441_c0_g2_i1:97-840(+)